MRKKKKEKKRLELILGFRPGIFITKQKQYPAIMFKSITS